MTHDEQQIKDRLANVERLRQQARMWLDAGDPDKSAGPSYWGRMEARLKEGVAAGYLSEDPELYALHAAFQQFKQQMWRRAGELLLESAKRAVDDARKACSEIEAVCAELENAPTAE